MLKLKRVDIQGFKSFYDRTEMRFHGSGIAAVVGPNGCGKSNLSDAISWVLGEQSAKSLRGSRMEDVIFAGTRERKPLGMAQVTLTMLDPAAKALAGTLQSAAKTAPDSDPSEQVSGEFSANGVNGANGFAPEATLNGDANGHAKGGPANGNANGKPATAHASGVGHHAHGHNGEVTITRRLYRSGESEYLIDGRSARLRDIQDLFSGTGLGPESYAIIEQGRIGQILSNKPADRRAIIEEAAGVGKYKTRKRLAEAKLEGAKQNLSRVFDILEEVGPPGEFAEAPGIQGQALRRAARGDVGAPAPRRFRALPVAGGRGREAGARRWNRRRRRFRIWHRVSRQASRSTRARRNPAIRWRRR